jgi:Cft2 family RNA processing exonuclease
VTHHVTWDRGISLVGHDMWLDPQTIRDVAFVSHAHSDHARRHRHALLTSETLELSPGPRKPHGARLLPLNKTVALGEAWVTLHDAGHMLGSAQVLFEHAGIRLLYTGDIKLRRGWGRPDTAIPRADVLVLESTYGQPHFRFPDPDSVVEALALFCQRALAANVIPVLLTHALGKAQEVMLALAEYGFEFALEERCVEPARAYERAGARLPGWVELDPERSGQRVVIAPPTGKDAIRRLPRHRTALVSGWAQDPSFWRLFGADFAFPYSDHCDFEELLAVIERSGAEKVYTVHGFTEELARHLRKRGVRAHALTASEQLALAL